MIIGGNNRVTGCVDLIPNEDGGDVNDLMQFGIFLMALLTFIYLISH